MTKKSFQLGLNFEPIQENRIKCLQSLNDYYLILPKGGNYATNYKLQTIGKTLCFTPIPEEK